MSELQWNGEAVFAELNTAVGIGVAAATIQLQTEIKQALSRQGTPTSARGRRGLARAFEFLAGKIRPKRIGNEFGRDVLRAFEANALGGLVDKAGGMPRFRSGDLHDSIEQEIDKETGDGIVGSAKVYARIHEYGGMINHPGGTPYIVIFGRPVFLSRDRVSGKRGVKHTKPHQIHIPARPYFQPTVRKSGAVLTKAFVDAAKASLGGDA